VIVNNEWMVAFALRSGQMITGQKVVLALTLIGGLIEQTAGTIKAITAEAIIIPNPSRRLPAGVSPGELRSIDQICPGGMRRHENTIIGDHTNCNANGRASSVSTTRKLYSSQHTQPHSARGTLHL